MDYTWAFTPDELIIPNYRNYLELYKKKDTLTSKDPFKTYEEYRQPYLREWEMINSNLFYIVLGYLFFLLLCYLPFSSPAHVVFRVNRKKRVIYWQTIFGSHAIAFVPEQGDR